MTVSEHERGCRIGKHISDTLRRIIRVERYIGATCLENPQQSRYHTNGSLHGNTDELSLLLDDALRKIGKVARCIVKFPVCDLLPFTLHSHGIRIFPGLLLEARVDVNGEIGSYGGTIQEIAIWARAVRTTRFFSMRLRLDHV